MFLPSVLLANFLQHELIVISLLLFLSRRLIKMIDVLIVIYRKSTSKLPNNVTLAAQSQRWSFVEVKKPLLTRKPQVFHVCFVCHACAPRVPLPVMSALPEC